MLYTFINTSSSTKSHPETPVRGCNNTGLFFPTGQNPPPPKGISLKGGSYL